jgi:hypothetical protein
MTIYWAARFLVAAELERRGYRVSLTDENMPGFDLSVTTPTAEQFVVDVKGLGSSTPWLANQTTTRKPILRSSFCWLQPYRRPLFHFVAVGMECVD